MIDLKNIEGFFFIGIGGIGMSALALYFRYGGYTVAGYDRTSSPVTGMLSGNGCEITFSDDIETIPSFFRNNPDRRKVLIVYTPAIPAENRIISFFRKEGYMLHKRSELLGEISLHTDTLAIAGTHGKTTVSTMTAHILRQSHVGCSAFLGGISKNYNTNLLVGEGRFTVMEADEFDRSFHRLRPLMAVVTSADADHLDIYGDQGEMVKAYDEFCTKIKPGGKLFLNSAVKDIIAVPEHVSSFTYGADKNADYSYSDVRRQREYYTFDLHSPEMSIRKIDFPFPGIINIENLTAAIAVAMNCGVTEEEIRKAALLFQGVRRRFDIRINMPGLAYIDDYAHHPEEIRAFVVSVKEYFRGRKITGIFQPHLFSRTRDHAEGFARILDQLDKTILLPVYPAREKPIPGVTSELIYEKMTSASKLMMNMEDITASLDVSELDILVTIGAGDIDTLVAPIEDLLKRQKVL
ncbi:MAG: UDP-N-acetylmuramate--L-alanine ligase [Bacteroidales bacterium]|jgi:UDP-N-acetylmuramate--alanine ligase|nr:UDP-N-acetylmuramate--L-alanine ligase [Bacteroidales bacterium]